MFCDLPTLGVGISFREQFCSELFLHQRQVDFLEIVAEHYLDVPAQKQQELELLAAHFPLIPHAINLSLGSAEGLDTDYLTKLANLIKRLNPPWWSEHICFTKAGGVDIGHLSPLPDTQEAVDVLCRNIEQVRCFIDTIAFCRRALVWRRTDRQPFPFNLLLHSPRTSALKQSQVSLSIFSRLTIVTLMFSTIPHVT